MATQSNGGDAVYNDQNAAQEVLANVLNGQPVLTQYAPSYSANGSGGVNYFFAGIPINREQYATITGNQGSNNVGAIENAAKSANNTKANVTPTPTVTGSGSSTNVAGEQAAYDDQINTLNQLLGTVANQQTNGIANLQNQEDTAMRGYADQKTANDKSRQSGIDTVNQGANSSYNSIQRLLQGANAGNSSVGRELAPYLISKVAGQQRAGVVDTAGANQKSIEDAQNNATASFENNKKSFLAQLLEQEQGLQGQLSAAQVAKQVANGSGYQAASAAAAGTRASQQATTNQINSLLGQYTPTAPTPALSTYQVDNAQVNSQNQGLPAESSLYLSQLLNKKNLQGNQGTVGVV
jgi:hypothetical protein